MKLLQYVAIVGMVAASAGAAMNPFGSINTLSTTSAVPVYLENAPSIDFEQGGKRMIASGGVAIVRGMERLSANTVVIDKLTDEATAQGNVVFTQLSMVTNPVVLPGGKALSGKTNMIRTQFTMVTNPVSAVRTISMKTNMIWRGETLVYNLKDGTWKTSGFSAMFDPFHVQSTGASKTNDYFVLNRAEFTTCTNEPGHYHYSMRCKRMRVYPNDHFVARHMVIRFGGVPVFYMPYWYCSLNDRTVGTTVQAGYRARMGAFLLTSTKYWMSRNLKGVTHVDYRAERGVGLGQEVGWVSTTNDAAKGRVYGYFLDDQGVKKDYNTGRRGELVDSQRYRLSFDHMQALSDRDYFLSDFTYLSDPYMLEDFFEREFRNSFQPQNYATVVHRGDNYSMNLSAYKRLNDFYEGVDRLPELGLDVQRVQIADSPIYYESQNSIAYLQKLYPDGDSTRTDYSSGRFDTSHEFFYPTRHFGFLNVIPRTGYRGTYYSETVQYTAVTQVVTVVTSNSLGGTTSSPQTNASTVATATGSDLRSLFNLGLETSFRAFKVLNNDENMFGTGLRHVVEPYTDYTFMPEPNLRPDRLYQFDAIDTLDRRNDMRFGVRNRLQTKRNMAVSDIVDFDVFTTYSFEEANREEPFSTVGFRGEFNLAEGCWFFSEGEYDLYTSQIKTFNTQARLKQDSWRANIEQRYLVDESSLVITDLGYAPNKRWEFGVYDRFEFQDSRLEEQGVTVSRTYDCMVVSLGGSFLPGYTRDDGSVREDDYRLMFQLFFTAFPGLKLGSSRRD